jgi:hypothetical protein
MRLSRRALAVLVVGLVNGSACSFDVAIPPGTQLACGETSDCPDGLTCKGGLCVDARVNDRPVLQLGAPVRGVASVTIPVDVADEEGDAVTFNAVQVADDGDTELVVSPSSSTSNTGPVDLVLSGFDAPDDDATPVHIRLTAADKGGKGVAAEIDAVVGNRAPSLQVLSVDNGVARGLAVIRLVVDDDPFGTLAVTSLVVDPPEAETESDLLAADAQAQVFPLGPPALVAGAETAFVWDSTQTHPVDLAQATLTVEVTDDLGATTTKTATFAIDNENVAPTVAITEGPAADDVVTGTIPFTLSIADTDADDRFVLSAFIVDDFGNERPALTSSVTAGLPTGDAAFLWQSDAVGQVGAARETVRLRFVVSDGNGAGEVTTPAFVVDNTALIGEVAPIVDLLVVDRPIDRGVLAFTLIDANGTALDPELVDLTIERDDGFQRTPITLAAGSAGLTGLDATIDGTGHIVLWDALADTPQNLRTFATVDGVERQIPKTQFVRLLVTAVDDGGRRTQAVFDVAVGNDAPEVSFGSPGAVISGEVPLLFGLRDLPLPGNTVGDPVDIAVDFSVDNAATFKPARIKLGSITDLAAGADFASIVLIWDTLDDTGGIGVANANNVFLRLTASDGPFEGRVHSGPAPIVGPFRIENQTPPRVEVVSVKSDGAGHFGLVPFTYRLLDEQKDDADILVEFSRDEGRTFTQATEAPTLRSEGVRDLVTDKTAAGGVLHTFVWDSTADLVVPSASTILRITARDDNGESAAVEVFRQRPAGPGEGDPALSLVEAPTGLNLRSSNNNNGVNRIALADIDNDGDLDLAAAVRPTVIGFGGKMEVVVRTNNGTGTFGGGQIIDTTCDPRQVALADVTCDGKPDLVVLTGPFFCTVLAGHANDPARIEVFPGNGNGTFGAPTIIQDTAQTLCNSDSVCSTLRMAVGDVNGDNRADVVVAYPQSNSTYSVFKNPSTGTCNLSNRQDVSLQGTGNGVALFDVDGDGTREIVLAHSGITSIIDGTTLVSRQDLSESFNTLGQRGFGDVDGDGEKDLVVLETDAGAVRKGTGGAFGARGTSFPLLLRPEATAFDDVTGDGRLDIVVAQQATNGNTGVVSILRGTADASASAVVSIALASSPQDVAIGDVDRDGLADILTADEAGGTLLRSRSGAGSLSFGSPVLSPGANGVAVAADLDGDSFLDGVSLASTVGFAFQRGVGFDRTATSAFAEPVRFASTDFVSNVTPSDGVVADFDGDGLLDVLTDTVRDFENALSVGYGPGDVGRASYADFHRAFFGDTAIRESHRFAAGDVDGDLLPEIVAIFGKPSGQGGNTMRFVAVKPAPGVVLDIEETFPAVEVDNRGAASPLRLADVDNDGDLDAVVLAVTNVSTVVDVLLNGGAALALPAIESTATNAVVQSNGLEVVDVNQDGFLDVVAVLPGAATSTVEVMLGTGTGAFGAPTRVTNVSGKLEGGLAALDVDGDGDLDLAVAGTAGVVLLENTGAGFGEIQRIAAPDAAVRIAPIVDVNGDLSPDLVLGTAGGVVALTSAREDPRGALTVAARPANGPIVDDVTDRFGRPRVVPNLVRATYAGPMDAFTGDLRDGASSSSHDFADQLRRNALALGMRPLTKAITVGGDVMLKKHRDVFGVVRTTIRHRFGSPDGFGDNTGLVDGREIAVDLPFLAPRNPANVRVFARVVTFEQELFGGDVPIANGKERFLERDRYEELAPGDFTVDAATGKVTVFVHELGTFQAFEVLP